MARKIAWTANAQKNRIEILTYWNEKTLSKKYSKKLNQLFVQNTSLLSRHNYLGKQTTIKDVRGHIVNNYIVFYKVVHSTIFILAIFDTRQNSTKILQKLL